MISIVEQDFNSFFDAPFNAYGNDSLYVSPMKSDLKRFLSEKENPLFKNEEEFTYFAALKNGKSVGRITAHVHTASNKIHKQNRAYFGYFDCVDDNEVASALLKAAENWAQRRGYDELMGNFNLTAMQQIGVQTGGFDERPYTDLVYSPEHIHRLLEINGYEREFPMTTFELDLANTELPEMRPKNQAIIENPDFEFVKITRSKIHDRMEDARQILNASFAKNPMFVPVSAEEFHFQSKDMKWIIDPRISEMLYFQGKPAACIICIPDLNPFLSMTRSRFSLLTPFHFIKHKFTADRAVLIFSGVIPELQGQGVNPVVLRRVLQNMKSAGYKVLGNTWIGDSNKASLAQKEKSHARKLHRLHLFRKQLR